MIEDLILPAKIGCHRIEKEVAQPIILNLKLTLDLKKAAQSDLLEDTLDYVHVIDQIKALISAKHYTLSEHLAYTIGIALLQTHPSLEKFKISIMKPKAIPEAKGVGCCLKLSREDL